jgi:signal transduction histidine kinase
VEPTEWRGSQRAGGGPRRPRVLVVDDLPENLLALQATLQGLPVDIDCADSGPSALKRLLVEDYAVILLDAHMPDMDGFETAELIKRRERTRHTPLVFLTAVGDDAQLTTRGYEVGAVDYLTKPLDPWILRSKVSIFTELWTAHERTRLLNLQLQAQTEELARSNRALEEFAYVASHDLQEPLRKVRSFCELLRSRYRGQLDERADQYIDFAIDGADRMSRLITDLLAYSRVGRSGPDHRDLGAEEPLDRALGMLATQIAETGAQVTHGPLPRVRGEAGLLTTVFQNLISNAIKFRADEAPRIHVSAAPDGALWRFCVRDNGIGIDPAFAEKVFAIFQRLHTKHAYPGTGIGLAICRKIVEYHGGTIWLDPDVSPGARFCFTLPASTDAPPPTTDPPLEPASYP